MKKFLGMKMKKMDERQLLLRGHAFKHMVLVMFILLVLSYFLAYYGGYSIAEGGWSYLIIAMVSFFIWTCEMLVRDVFTTGRIYKIIFLILYGIFGIVLLILSIIGGIQGNIGILERGFFTDKSLSTAGVALVMGILCFALGVVLFIKIILDRRKNKDENAL